MELTAYEVAPHLRQNLEPAARQRPWIDGLPEKYGRRCLPMMIANQHGWHIALSEAETITWDGGTNERAVSSTGQATGIFGWGIATFNVAWVFRTPPGWNLLVRGPANAPIDGIAPLEGVVETDWASQTFTMNWKFTRPGSVIFGAGEAICLLVPQRRGDLEAFDPVSRPIQADAKTHQEFARFSESRDAFQASGAGGWEKDYHRGRNVGDSEPATPEHQRRLTLRPFADG